MANTDNPELPNFTRQELEDARPELELIDDLIAGTPRMHAKSHQYITKWPDEKPEVWKFRRVRETVFGGLERTVSAATGMLFAKAPQVEWNNSETAMSEHLQNVDAAGTKVEVFVKRFAESCIKDGLAILVVDHPSPPEDTLITAANEKALGLRPTWAMYSRLQGISWFDDVVNNKRVLTQLTLAESATVRDGEFGVKNVQRYRDIRLLNGQATWKLYEQKKEEASKPEDFEVIASGVFKNRKGQIADFLPVAIGYAGRTDQAMCAKPPLAGVAHSNKAHWQIMTDLRFNSEVVGFDQLVVQGQLQKDANGVEYPIQIGPLTAIQVEENGDAGWKGPTGTGLDQLEKRALEKMSAMAQQGLSFLQKETRAAETAESKRLDATAENSTLATAAQGIEDAVNLALEFHAWYLGIDKASAPVLTISKDYEDTTMDASLMGAYTALVNSGFPKRLVIEALIQGGRLPQDTDVEETLLEWESGAQAEAEAKAIEAEERARNNNPAAKAA